MDERALRERLAELFRPYHVPDWELEEHAEILAALPGDAARRVLELVPSIWPVSHALTFSFLRQAGKGLATFGETRLQIWVGAILEAYEAGGLEEAQPVIADGGRAFVAEVRGEQGLRFRDAAPLLRPYLCGIAERTLEIAEGREAATDTAVVWLPRRIAALGDPPGNLLLYKLAAAVQWGHIARRTYRARLEDGDPLLERLRRGREAEFAANPAWLVGFFRLHADAGLAQRLFQAAATVAVARLVAEHLPGLAREAGPRLVELFARREPLRALPGREGLFERIRRWTWLPAGEPGLDEPVGAAFGRLRFGSGAPAEALRATAALYEQVAAHPPDAGVAEPLPFEGVLVPSRAEERRLARRQEAREHFVEAFRALYAPHPGGGVPEGGAPADGEKQAADAPAVPELGGESSARADVAGAGDEAVQPGFIRIGAQVIEVPDELRPLLEEIRDDLGGVPPSYVAGVLAKAGRAAGRFAGPAVPEGPPAESVHVYDEWDFRRAGYRKGWCSLHELELAPAGDDFVRRTVLAYRGPLLRIRRAFEFLRAGDRRARRQRDGDELDIDALVEARADVLAGLAAPEGLFVRLVRDTRDIAAAFLVDMSSSTEGWVNLAMRESLVLLCEALEVLGDRYAVYGFSGTRRLRAELFRVKRFAEPYGAAVKGRIAAIEPRDYTRMGPPIRHLTRLLRATDAKTRLLVILSDGKPEDYDEYKGDYAVEDTRHALLEAKIAGVHPFCITLDREARDYVGHLFGDVNYVVVDTVANLPLRVPAIYRSLTT
jgi:nitric oxide reductase NorD protein